MSITAERGYCFISGMTAKQKILTEFIVIGMILFIYLLCCIGYKQTRTYCTNIFFGRDLNFGKTFIAMLLLCIGKILSILFKLVSCQRVGESFYVHLYFANDECFDGTWWISLICLVLIVMLFCVLLLKVFMMDPNDRQNDNNVLRPLTLSYRPGCFYWEFIILLRRVLIISLSVSFANNMYVKFVIISILCLFVILHRDMQPFINEQVNKMEFILLISMIIVTAVDVINDTVDNDVFIYSTIIILILMPFVLLIMFFMQYVLDDWKGLHPYDDFEMEFYDEDDEKQDTDPAKSTLSETEQNDENTINYMTFDLCKM
eukprot:281354_1